MPAEPTTIGVICSHPIFVGAAGGTVGIGIMVVFLVKWGCKIFGGSKSVSNSVDCPYAGDHPKLQEFMGASMQDRKDMREFLSDINGKVNGVSMNIGNIEGKLDMLLKGARVRWNAGLIPPDKDGK